MAFKWQWDVNTKGKFADYGEDDQAAIEQAFQAGGNVMKLNESYSIDFAKGIQYRTDDPHRQRAIRRVPPIDRKKIIPKKAAQKKRKVPEKQQQQQQQQQTDSGEPASKRPKQEGFAKNRLSHDYRSMKKSEARGELNFTLDLIDDDLYKWEIKLGEFDETSQLAKDLEKYSTKHGINSLTVRFIFDDDYPLKAPFVHVVTPKLTGGYIFSGGLCMSSLMQGWVAGITPESLLLQVRQILQDGQARIHNINKVEWWDEKEARAGFSMAASAHANDKSFED